MRRIYFASIALALPSALSLHAEERGFHNILTSSRSIIAPSQYYQIREGAIVEAEAGFTDGTDETQTAATAKDNDVTGTNYGLGAFLALNPSLVFGVNARIEHLELGDISKGNSTIVSPSVTYSPVPALAFGVQANIIGGHEKVEGQASENANCSTFTLGMTAHQEEWEATAVISTENKDDDTRLNQRPQILGLHARYRIVETITLGASFAQKNYSSFDHNAGTFKDETELGVHMESAMSETFSIEVDYLSSTGLAGIKDVDGSEFVLLGQALVTATLEAGARLSYKTMEGGSTRSNTVSPSLFVSMKL